MPIIHDEEFGKITIRRSARATQVRVRIAPDGTLRASLPLYAPLFLVKRLLASSRDQLRTIIAEASPTNDYSDGMQIGKSHSISVTTHTAQFTKVSRHGQKITVMLASSDTLNSLATNRMIRDVVITALRIEAKSYLPKRLSYLAHQYGCNYEKIRFSHASGRWGSCSSSGTISLNIALMKLPFELIDYVLIHELSHTRHMNHSAEFWQLVAGGDPQYRIHRRLLKHENPSI